MKMSAKGRSSLCRNLLVFKLMLLLLAVMVFLSILVHQYVSNMAMSETPLDTHKTRTQLEYYNDHENEGNAKPLSSYQFEIEELKRIKVSVKNELRDLENKRLKLQSEISSYSSNIDGLKVQQSSLSKDVKQIRLALEQVRFEQEESKAYIPNIKAPHRILHDVDHSEKLTMPDSPVNCRMESCFDFSRCSLVSGFPVFFYDPYGHNLQGLRLDQFIMTSYSEYFENNVYRTREPTKACIFILVVGEHDESRTPTPGEVERFIHSLPHWNGDGRNHVLINLARSFKNTDLFKNVNTGRAILAQSAFINSSFRDQFDVLIPPAFGLSSGENAWKGLPPISPIRRRLLLTYWGQYITDKVVPDRSRQRLSDHQNNRQQADVLNRRHLLSVVDSMSFSSSQSFYSQIEQAIVSSLKNFQKSHPGSISVDMACSRTDTASFVPSDWAVCGTESIRKERIIQSTFTLILPSLNISLHSSLAFQSRVFEALKYGSIPIILGSHGHMPFSEILHWESASISLPTPRVTELPFYLQSIPDEDLATLRLKGRHFYLHYFSSTHGILDTIIALLRKRLQIPAMPASDEPYITAFPPGFTPLKYEGPVPEPESDEVLGPIESPFPSEKFRHNFTQFVTYDVFNSPGDPFTLYPNYPFILPLPSESKFLGSNYGFRPVARGAGGDGVQFSQALGGNLPREQFTVVMLTYDREVVLLQALARFKGLPFLNKVLVVWNNPEPPSSDLRWPEIGVAIEIVKTKKNSLNNRFLPYDVIETEAVLSIDDDAHLRHDEIVFGFRVWREERARIVGFPGRFHAWDLKHRSWNYNSNYSCELSMVLTGAAFFHKYYAYLYSYVMPQAIRDKVDEFMNCEDIAMNFLVAHISRKPPVKVTSRWTFRCPGCPTTLSSNSSHFEERHQCINFFTEVYGYMPLLYTQFRVDSVLFKTRISHDKAKCFKYI